jgi:hypothetical protein
LGSDSSSNSSSLIAALSALSSGSTINLPLPHSLRIDDDGRVVHTDAANSTYDDILALLNVLNRPPSKDEVNSSGNLSSAPLGDEKGDGGDAPNAASNVTNAKVAAAILVHHALKKAPSWDPILLHLYCQDSIGSRVWVDDSDHDVRSFVSILEASFDTQASGSRRRSIPNTPVSASSNNSSRMGLTPTSFTLGGTSNLSPNPSPSLMAPLKPSADDSDSSSDEMDFQEISSGVATQSVSGEAKRGAKDGLSEATAKGTYRPPT